MASRTKVAKLTPEQERLLVEREEASLAACFSTTPLDRGRAENAVGELYRRLEAKVPDILWARSKVEAWELIRRRPERRSLAPAFHRTLGQRWDDQPTLLRAYLAARKRAWRETLRHTLHNHFLKGAAFSLDAFERAVEHFLPPELKSATDLTADDYPAFSQNGYLRDIQLALFERDHLGVKFDRNANADLERLAEAVHACPALWLYESFCIVVESPRIVRTEPAHRPVRLHCEDGPAVEYTMGSRSTAFEAAACRRLSSRTVTRSPFRSSEPKRATCGGRSWSTTDSPATSKTASARFSIERP